MTALPLTPASADKGHFDCHYFSSGACRSCSLLETPYRRQIFDKEAWCREIMAGHIAQDPLPSADSAAAPDGAELGHGPGSHVWLPAATSADHAFRNRAKLAVGGSVGRVTLGILDQEFHGVDLRDCGIQVPEIRAAIPVIAEFLDASGLVPYQVAHRRGELKFVHITAAPSGDLMIRFVVRTQYGLEVLKSRRDRLSELLPRATVISINLLPEHKAVLEGSTEVMLMGESLRMNLDRVDLHLRPQSFFQTNTSVATELYRQVATWVDDISPTELWDLYCGVGGFALYCADGAADRRVVGVELSPQAIESAKLSASELGIDVRFLAGDATEFAEAALNSRPGAGPDSSPTERPDCVIVNPPRRGIGARLSTALENSGVEHLVYSSCNPVTLAKDLDRMPSYEVTRARVFDMFPHTKHLEVAVVLRRMNG